MENCRRCEPKDSATRARAGKKFSAACHERVSQGRGLVSQKNRIDPFKSFKLSLSQLSTFFSSWLLSQESESL